MQERLQKILSGRGVCSRRKAEEYILEGLVKVNGKVANLGQKADPELDKITVEGKVIQDRKEMMYYVMNKPVGVVTTNLPRKDRLKKGGKSTSDYQDPSSTVRDILPKELQGKIYPVGRLDKDSCGLLLFTNDGVLAYRLTHPKFEHDKEYEVVLDRPIEPLAMKTLEKGFMLDGSKTKSMTVKKVEPEVIRIILTEGKNRQIRRMCQHVGYTVKDLKRVRIMTLEDAKLKIGTTRTLTPTETKALLKSVGL